MLKKIVVACFAFVAVAAAFSLGGTPKAHACGSTNYAWHQSTAFNDSAEVNAWFCYSTVSYQASYYANPVGAIDLGTAVQTQGPGYSYWQDGLGRTNMTFWYNAKFSNGKCLYPRALGYWDGSVSGYDGSNLSGNCSF